MIQEALIMFEMEVCGVMPSFCCIANAHLLFIQYEKAEDYVLDQVSLYCNAQAISLDPLHSLWDTITFLKSVSGQVYNDGN